MTDAAGCVKCGQPLPARSGPGRPARFCGVGCRRASEYELRRAQRHLERLERERLEAHRWADAGRGPYGMAPKEIRRTIGQLEAEIAGLEDRLRTLLTASETE